MSVATLSASGDTNSKRLEIKTAPPYQSRPPPHPPRSSHERRSDELPPRAICQLLFNDQSNHVHSKEPHTHVGTRRSSSHHHHHHHHHHHQVMLSREREKELQRERRFAATFYKNASSLFDAVPGDDGGGNASQPQGGGAAMERPSSGDEPISTAAVTTEEQPSSFSSETSGLVIRALSFDHIFGTHTAEAPHPTVHVHGERHPLTEKETCAEAKKSLETSEQRPVTVVVRSKVSTRSSSTTSTPTIKIATIGGEASTAETLPSPASSSPLNLHFKHGTTASLQLGPRPRHSHNKTPSTGDSYHVTVTAQATPASWEFVAGTPEPRRRRGSSDSVQGTSHRPCTPTLRPHARGNQLVSPRSQASTVGTTKSTTRSVKSHRSTGSNSPQPQKHALERTKTQYTGPGFASLPPALARSPTSRLLTTQPHVESGDLSHTASSVSSSTTLSPNCPLSNLTTLKSSTLQSIPEKQSKLSTTTTTSTESGSRPLRTGKRSDTKKLLFRRIFGGDTVATGTSTGPSTNFACDQTSDLYPPGVEVCGGPCLEVEPLDKTPPLEEERKKFGKRALSIIGIGVDRKSGGSSNGERTPESSGSQPSKDPKKGFGKRVSLKGRNFGGKAKAKADDHTLFQRLKSTLDLYSGPHGTCHPNMGNSIPNCCGARPDAAAKDLSGKDEAALKFLAAQGGQTDLDKFDRAYAEDDISALVALVSSKEAFEQPAGENLHPWAASPKSVGALATTQLAALASVEDTGMKERIRVAGAIPILVDQLASSQQDRRDAALVALSFLSIDYARACMDMYEAGIFAPLIDLLKSSKVGVRAAAAQTARNIYVLEVRYRRAFRDAGGCQPLVDLLDTPAGKHDPETLDIQLEAVYHIDDFIMFNGEEVSDCIAAIKVCNTARKLEALLNVEQDDLKDLKEAARQLYLRVAE
eukprot:Blabericola_migrator_1__881@NODE_1216_length_5096_cov_101_127660_g825_i0_p1_GENE_NODE_1216_length_5096_cov_101_127660_g825_i0NODE_1216_length_5096_cov_101_127660_g825_i0_p1_ORF_typecomplete_len926_score124_19Arm/PF00514_23/0_4Arm/PF00514_23/0_023Arm/PF00514_23/0_041KAP/PF05804_12/9_6e06Arm_2/PF04826_13/2_4Arm_2/PF04826_13/29HEAT_2/PF13646_6/0_045HEAT_2/PF13646_6/0_012HEAT_2/PF13646_6/1_1e04HEAT_EZ/PF13513_6/40HEAT_EZ/PF13513_6/2_3IFRD/PF05004_13/19IFRD/PF05004_13/3_7Herpes_LMP1/PF05297_11/5_1_NO